jgi:DNA-binding transcriptional LysR family regulator
MWPYLREGRLELVMDSRSVLGGEVHVVRQKSRHMPSKVRVAVDALVEDISRTLGSELHSPHANES